MSIKRATPEDPRGVIAESYHIENLTEGDARIIFLGWAMVDAPEDPKAAMQVLLERHEKKFYGHPMNKLLFEGVQSSGQKRNRRQKNTSI